MLEALLGRPELSDKSVFCPSLTFSLTSISKLSSELVSAEYLLHLEKPPTLSVLEKGAKNPQRCVWTSPHYVDTETTPQSTSISTGVLKPEPLVIIWSPALGSGMSLATN